MKKVILAVIAIAALAIPSFAQTAAPSRVAVINVQKVLTDSNVGKAATEQLKKMQDEREAQMKRLTDELSKLESDISSKKMSLSEDKLADMQKQYNDKKVALQRFAQDAQAELDAAQDKALGQIEKDLMPVINQVGKEMGFAAIFNKYQSGLVYASEAIDITDVIVKRFNETSASAAPKK